jgi:hypothetical protein
MMQEKVEGKSQKSEKRSNASSDSEQSVEAVAPLSTAIHNRQFDQPNRLNPAVILRMQNTYGNAYVSRMLSDRATAKTRGKAIQRAVNKEVLDKLGTAASNVPDIPNDFPGAFNQLNTLPIADLIDTLVAFRDQGDFDFLLAHFGQAQGIDVGLLMSGFLFAAIRGTTAAAPPSDQTLNRMALALRTTRADLAKTVLAQNDSVRTQVMNTIPTLVSGSVTGSIPEVVGGVRYVVASAYDWQMTGTEIKIIVKFKFTGATNPGIVSSWFSRITGDWNVFKAVDTTATPPRSMNITFEPQAVGGGEHHAVQVMPGGGRDNEGQWYLGATPGDEESMRMAAHEFGHTVGLKDEYQLNHGDFVSTVGAEPGNGMTRGLEFADVVAKDLHDALHPAAPASPAPDPAAGAAPAPTPAQNALTVINNNLLKQGTFAQKIATEYKKAYSIELVADIVATIPSADQFWIVNPFTFSDPGMMGSQTMDHAHSVQPRHVADFARIVQSERGGKWEPQPR